MENNMILKAVLMLALTAGPAAAEAPLLRSGNAFAASCGNMAPKQECVAYIKGVADGLNLAGKLNDKPLICAPEAINGRQMALAVRRFLKSHYDFRTLSPASIIWMGLAQAFPCPSR
jgi:hypothetical protein